MNNKTEKVFRGYLSLSSSEKKELLEEIRKYDELSESGKERTRGDVVRKVDLGPVGQSACPCCGK
jgi:hypothetical protein